MRLSLFDKLPVSHVKLIVFTNMVYVGVLKNKKEREKTEKIINEGLIILKTNNWKLLQPTSSEIESRTTTKMSFYGKEISSKDYYIILNLSSSKETTLKVEKTQIKLSNGTEFDKWVAEFESMGYNFKKVSGIKGHLFSGEKGMMIKVGISNMDYAESEWSYEISIITDNK
jgi:hypothetical protein